MNFLAQFTPFLTEAPGSLVYHLVTLFALQAIVAISWSHWRRDPTAVTASRTAVAAALLLLSRLGWLLLLGLAIPTIQQNILSPPLEQAVQTAVVGLLLWALLSTALPKAQLADIALFLGSLLWLLLTISFVLAWQPSAIAAVPYAESAQIGVWLLLQTAVCLVGLGGSLLHRPTRTSLAPFIFLTLLLTSLAAWVQRQGATAVPDPLLFYGRVGHLLALPLWLLFTYRQAMAPLLLSQQANRPALQQLQQTLQLATATMHPADPQHRDTPAIRLLQASIDVSFVAIGRFMPQQKQRLHLVSNLPQPGADAPRSWQLDLADWPPFGTAVSQKTGVALTLHGQHTRYLPALAEAMQIGPLATVWVEPLVVDDEVVGLLLLGRRDGRMPWTPREKALAPALATFIAQALHPTPPYTPAIPPPVSTLTPVTPSVSGHIIALEAERDRLATELATTANRANQAEARAVVALKRAHDLAQTLEEMERLNRDEQIASLEQEIETLRESLDEAEAAMAMAAAGESELSTEWIMLAITRYSGQLEEAQLRIQTLENQLAQQAQAPVNDLLVALIQELRTPMTSISGFTQLLLAETMGLLGSRQRDLLQRVQANTRRMGNLLDQLLQLMVNREQATPTALELTDVRDVIETAVTHLISQIRDKNLRLDLTIPADLPPLLIKQADLQQMLNQLLTNACQASPANGRVQVSAQSEQFVQSGNDSERLHFLQVNVTDSGSGIAADDLPHVFTARHRADAPLIKGLGDTSAGLVMAHDLAQAYGGRIWVDSRLGHGSTFSLLFPLGAAAPTAVASPNRLASLSNR